MFAVILRLWIHLELNANRGRLNTLLLGAVHLTKRQWNRDEMLPDSTISCVRGCIVDNKRRLHHARSLFISLSVATVTKTPIPSGMQHV
jgi:hypothetical protein